MYSISCYISKIVVDKDGINAIQIKPTGRSRIEGDDGYCLGFDSEKKQVKMFSLEIPVNPALRDVILMVRIHGKEVELMLEGGKLKEIVI